jgi:erythromycin esterase-like protein
MLDTELEILPRLIGFGTHTGTVAAPDDRDEPMQVKRVRPSLEGSHERVSHDGGVDCSLLDLRAPMAVSRKGRSLSDEIHGTSAYL